LINSLEKGKKKKRRARERERRGWEIKHTITGKEFVSFTR